MTAFHLLMATYNGARFIDAQLESILAQAHRDWVLWVRDDGSTDGTLERIRAFARKERRIRLLTDNQGRLGWIGNFGALVAVAHQQQAPLVAFCDQDDVWAANKLTRLGREYLNHDPSRPRVVFSDMAVVGPNLQPRHSSLVRFTARNPRPHRPLHRLLAQGYIPGASCTFNTAALNLAHPFPESVIHHDWWVPLVTVGGGGSIGFVDEPLVHYRQHGQNTIGAQSKWQRFNPFRFDRLQWVERMTQSREQARSALDRLRTRNQLDSETERVFEAYIAAMNPNRTGLARCWGLYRLGITRDSWGKTFTLYGRLLTARFPHLRASPQ